MDQPVFKRATLALASVCMNIKQTLDLLNRREDVFERSYRESGD